MACPSILPAFFLHGTVAQLSVVNPRRIKAYGDSQLRRSKTDPADARLIAAFCANQGPEPWRPPSPAQRKLKALARRIEALKTSLHQENNRIQQTDDTEVKADLRAHMGWLRRHIAKLEASIVEAIQSEPAMKQAYELIRSVKGFGERSAASVLAEIPDIECFEDARQLAAFAGVTPRHHTSGTSGKVRTPMSKAGCRRLRKALFFPAMSAMRHNVAGKRFAERLRQKGKPPLVIIGALMTKLLHWIYGVLKSQKPFNPDHHGAPSATA